MSVREAAKKVLKAWETDDGFAHDEAIEALRVALADNVPAPFSGGRAVSKVLIIIRGLPGSGKSKLAEMIDFYQSVVDPEAVAIHEADQYFVKDGIYSFNPMEIPNAHRMCYNNTSDSLKAGRPYVIVSNTSTRQWEFKKYIDLAHEHGYKVQVIDVHGEFDNVHGVPEELLKKMEERWEPFDRTLLRKSSEQL